MMSVSDVEERLSEPRAHPQENIPSLSVYIEGTSGIMFLTISEDINMGSQNRTRKGRRYNAWTV